MNSESMFSLDFFIDLWNEHKTKISITVALIGGGVGLAFYWYTTTIARQEAAQIALAETFMEIERAHRNPEAWQDAELAAKTGYNQFSSSSLAPYFLSLQAESLIEQGKNQEALALLEEVKKSLSSSSPLYTMYALKIARIKLDAQQEDIRQQGLQELEKLAYDTKNQQRDAALYYLSLVYEKSDMQKAQQLWHEIVAIAAKQQEVSNAWAALSQRRLDQEVA
jgi:hypothetical protein